MTDLSAGKSLHQPGGSPPDGPELEPGALRHGGEERRWLVLGTFLYADAVAQVRRGRQA